jgi:plastocyanin
MVRGFRSHIPVAFALLFLLASCGSDSPTGPQSGTIEVELRDTSFSPGQVTITPGSTIRWVNQGNIVHTVTPDGHDEWERATFSSDGDTFSHTFTEEGVYAYYCEPHRGVGMVGTIRVEAGS